MCSYTPQFVRRWAFTKSTIVDVGNAGGWWWGIVTNRSFYSFFDLTEMVHLVLRFIERNWWHFFQLVHTNARNGTEAGLFLRINLILCSCSDQSLVNVRLSIFPWRIGPANRSQVGNGHIGGFWCGGKTRDSLTNRLFGFQMLGCAATKVLRLPSTRKHYVFWMTWPKCQLYASTIRRTFN